MLCPAEETTRRIKKQTVKQPILQALANVKHWIESFVIDPRDKDEEALFMIWHLQGVFPLPYAILSIVLFIEN
jgi:hypothetical protein